MVSGSSVKSTRTCVDKNTCVHLGYQGYQGSDLSNVGQMNLSGLKAEGSQEIKPPDRVASPVQILIPMQVLQVKLTGIWAGSEDSPADRCSKSVNWVLLLKVRVRSVELATVLVMVVTVDSGVR